MLRVAGRKPKVVQEEEEEETPRETGERTWEKVFADEDVPKLPDYDGFFFGYPSRFGYVFFTSELERICSNF